MYFARGATMEAPAILPGCRAGGGVIREGVRPASEDFEASLQQSAGAGWAKHPGREERLARRARRCCGEGRLAGCCRPRGDRQVHTLQSPILGNVLQRRASCNRAVWAIPTPALSCAGVGGVWNFPTRASRSLACGLSCPPGAWGSPAPGCAVSSSALRGAVVRAICQRSAASHARQ